MKIDRSVLPVLIFIAFSMFALAPFQLIKAANDKSLKEVRKGTRELLQTLKSYSAKQRDKAIKESRAALKDLDGRIESLEEHIDKNWDEMDKAARQKARASLKTLRTQRNKVAELYGAMKNSSAEAWDNMKEGFSDGYQELYDTYQELYDAWKEPEEESLSNK
ncbi:MAG: hypothetical protein R6W72_00310 [Desulfurivibrionaceae bacterium]